MLLSAALSINYISPTSQLNASISNHLRLISRRLVMTALPFKAGKLFLAINTILLSTATAYAAGANTVSESDTEAMPSATLPTITVVSKVEGYTTDSTDSATGLDLEFKEIPKNTTTVTNEMIKDQQLDRVTDVVHATSGVHAQMLDGSRTQFSARGFAIKDFNVDGLKVSYDSGWGEGGGLSTSSIYDKVEVVKGANGLMDGSGNPSASINFIRKKADTSEFNGELSATYDKFDGYSATVDIGSKLNQSGTIRGRAIVNYTDGDTYIDREDKSNKTAYVVVDADITEATLVSIGGMRQERIQDEVMWGGLPIFYTDGSRIDWDTNQSMAVDWGKRDGISDEVFASVEHNFNEDWKLKLSGSYAETEGDMKLFYADGLVYKPNGLIISGFNANGFIPSLPYSYIWQTDTTDTNLTTKLNGSYNAFGRKHQLMLGADYKEYETKAISQNGSSVLPVMGVVNNWNGTYPEPSWGSKGVYNDYTIKEKGLYGATQLQLSDSLTAVVGARVSSYEKEGVVSNGKQIDIEHDSEWTPFAGLTYAINNNSSIFASYTDVFKPQEKRTVTGNFLVPIVGDNYEIGIKSTNDANTLQSQFSIFRIKQDNLAQADTGKLVPNTVEQAYYAAEGATSTGIDVEVNGQLNNNWRASMGYTHFNIEDANDQAVNTEYPTTLIKLFTTYDLNKSIPGLTIGGGVNWMNERYITFSNPLKGGAIEKLSEDSVALVNLMAKYEVNDNLDLQINLDNIFDEKYINSFGFSQITFAEPFNVKGKISYKW